MADRTEGNLSLAQLRYPFEGASKSRVEGNVFRG
jgi:hypothetical protein